MSYTINLTDGATLVAGGLTDGTVNTTATSLTLIGKDYAGYGQFLNENFVYLLENFANTSSPPNPLTGQLWWDKTNNILRVYSGSSWKISTGATASPVSQPPTDLSALGGDLWFDNTNNQLKVYTGASWITIGPVTTPTTGNSGAVPVIMTDTSSGTHIVIQFLISGIVYAVISKDTFTSSLTGFTNIVAGINFSSIASPTLGMNTQSTAATPNTLVQRDGNGGATVAGLTATNITASTITTSGAITGLFSGSLVGNVTTPVNGSVVATNMYTGQLTANSGITGTLVTGAQTGITQLGTLSGLNVNGTTSLTGSATLNGSPIATTGGSASFSSINSTPVGNATPSTGAFTALSVNTSFAPVVSANASIPMGSTTQYWSNFYSVSTNVGTENVGTINVSNAVLPVANATVNLGSSGAWFNEIYGTAIHAQYADLAERFHADEEYPAGTVVEMGGVNEITKVVEELSERVFGVISTNAAYLMNSRAGTDATHPPIAMSGRVPVRVTGIISKGDRLVSAGNGLARTGLRSELTPFNVIGRALENKTTDSEGVIEAIVKLNS